MRLVHRKLARYLLVLLAILTLNFALPRLMPGDPALNLMGEHFAYDPETIDEVRSKLGLEGPVHLQFLRYLGDLAQGDLGYSFTFKRPVAETIWMHLPWTLLLLIPAVITGALIALVLGTLAGWHRNSRLDLTLSSAALLVYSMPHYWIAMLVVMLFSFRLGLFPLAGAYSGSVEGVESIADLLWHLALPLGVVTLYKASYDLVIVRNSVITTMAEDHVIAAMARGVPLSVVLVRHVVRNSLAPLVTVTALQFGNIFAGALLVEIVFSWPGMGTMIFDAVGGRDYPLLQASFMIIAVCVLVANIVADFTYARLDPRIN
ncbi:MAG: ABC transporter permease [Chloroflexota bacterium]